MNKKYSIMGIALVTVVAGTLPWFSSSAIAGVYPDTPDRLWPNGVVPYLFDGNFIASNQDEVLAAMQVWMDVSNVSFIAWTNETDFLQISNAPSGGSRYPPPEGYRAGTGAHQLLVRQNLSALGSTVQQVYGLAHELGHALGLFHTHQRQDRETYFTYNPNVTTAGGAGNYNVALDSFAWPRGWADIDSIMSYPLCTFTTCMNCAADPDNCSPIVLDPPYDADWVGFEFCPTIEAAGDICIGQRNHLSAMDVWVMQFLYPPSDWVFVDETNPAGDGSFHDPYHYFTSAYANVSPNGTILIIDPGNYTADTTLDQPMRLEAPLGGVILQP